MLLSSLLARDIYWAVGGAGGDDGVFDIIISVLNSAVENYGINFYFL